VKGRSAKAERRASKDSQLLFFANAAGGKELSIVIGKAAKPRCFKGISNPKKPAGTPYYSSSNAWMTTDIMTSDG